MKRTVQVLIGAGVLATATTFGGIAQAADDTIKVGVLHSLSGTMAISETTLKDPHLLLVDEPVAGMTDAETEQTAALRHIPDEVFDLFPMLRDMLSRRGGDLSGGQQQQLAIARGLADSFAVMDRGEVVLAGTGADMVEDDVRRYLTV